MSNPSEDNNDIIALLDELKAAGEQDSAGGFTIDPKKAREKFREFGLGELHEYTCVLVSALVAGGATFIDIEADSDDFIVTSDFFASHHELEQLFSLASGGHDSVHFFRLALGLQAALALEPQKVELECWDGSRGSHLKLDAAHLRVEPIKEMPWENEQVRSRLHVREKPSLRVVGRFVRKTFADEATPEQELLRERCHLSPIPVKLNGSLLNEPADLGNCRAYLVLGAEGVLKMPPSLPNVSSRQLPAESFTAYVAFSEEQKQEHAEVVLSGLSMPGWQLHDAQRVVVYSDSLTTDLSLSKLVHDAQLESLQSQIREAMVEALPEWLEGPLSYANRFPTTEEPLEYSQLKGWYDRLGFLTVVTHYQGPPHGEAPLVKAGTAFLDLLFPEQVKDEAIPGLLPPGNYRARSRLPSGLEIGLNEQPQRPATDWSGSYYSYAQRNEGTTLPLPRWVALGEGPRPELGELLKLYEKAPMGTISLPEALDLLGYVLSASTLPVRTISDLMEEPSSPFELDPESFLSRMLATVELPTVGGESVSLERLVCALHSGRCWKRFTDHPLRFEAPKPDTVEVPESQYSALCHLVGFMKMKHYPDVRNGLIDTSGNLVCEPEVVGRGEKVRCGRLKFRLGDLSGFTDSNGVPTTEAIYFETTEYEQGLAVVRHGEGDYQLMDLEGHYVGPLCEFICDPHDGLRLACRAGRYGYLNRSGEIAIPFELESAGHFGEGEALATRGGRRIFIDHSGAELRECRSQVESMGPLKEGLRMSHSDGKWGFLDQAGEWVIPLTYSMAAPPDGGLIPVKFGQKWGLIDRRGSQVVPFRYDWMDLEFCDDLIAIRTAGNYGYLNRLGEETLMGFQGCGGFNSGLAPAQKESKWGYINRAGIFVIEPSFLSANSFSEERAVVSVYNS